MIITKDFVFIHMPKTAGTALYAHLEENGLIEHFISHGHFKAIPERYKDRRKIVFLRDPLDWYVSHYFFHFSKKGSTGASVYSLTADFADFDCYVKSATNLKESLHGNREAKIRCIERHIYWMLNPDICYWLPVTWLHKILPEDIETEYQLYMDYFGITEGIKTGELEAFNYKDFNEVMEFEFGITGIKPKNQSDHEYFKKYYSKDLIELVQSREKNVLDLINFSS